jgi:hypothetical protein
VSADAPARTRAEASRWGGVVAWTTWLGSLAAALWFVGRYASNVPSWDDWDMIPTLTRFQPVTWEWLWSQHNEHRVPLPRLVFLALDRIFGIDMRVTMVADVLLMAGVAAALLLVVARVRGRLRPTDLFLPLVLLSLGQAANLLWGWQLQFFASAALAGVALAAIALTGPVAPATTATIVGLCALLLPLCGANGLGMAPALAAWPLALALLPERWTGTPEARRHPVLLGLGVTALLLSAIYFVGWERVPYHPRSRGVGHTLITGVKFLTIGLGPVASKVWPASGLVTLAVIGGALWRLATVGRDQPAERAQALGLACHLGALGALALGLGLGREGFEQRYDTLAAPVWCALYLIWVLYPGRRGRLVAPGLAVAAVAALWGNTAHGLAYAGELRHQLGGFERDLAAGVPLPGLLHRYGPWLHPHQDMPARYLPMLRSAGVSPYTALRTDTGYAVVPVALEPVTVAGLTWRGRAARIDSTHSAVVFALPAERMVSGLRLRYRFQSDHGALPYVALRWKPTAQPTFDGSRFYKFSPTGDRANWTRGTWDAIGDSATTLTVWTEDTMAQVQVGLDGGPGVLRIDELSLLVRER